ncbi:putative membrane transporter protein [Gammaproteobacteria bacterium]
MDISFVELNTLSVLFLFLVGFVGGLVSGFIGSGGAFVLTPAMMNMGVSAIMAVASNICHKFPKALVGAMKRHKYGQVDVKLGVVLGISAEAGVLYGAQIQENIVASFGKAGSNLYVSVVFVVVLAIVGSYVLRDAWNMYHSANPNEEKLGKAALWIRSIHIPGTMMYFPSVGTPVSVLFTIPMGFATGMLAATIAVGGFVGVPAMMYLLGVPGLMASATELVIAFVMGLGGTVKYGWHGYVDVRLAMIILAGSLFGIQLGAIGTTYVKPYMVKIVMGVIMILVLFSRLVAIPVYLSDLNLITPMLAENGTLLKNFSFGMMIFALLVGATIVLKALIGGMREYRREQDHFTVDVVSTPPTGAAQIRRLLLVVDGSEYGEGAIAEAIRLTKACDGKLHIMTVLPLIGLEHDGLGNVMMDQEKRDAVARLYAVRDRAAAAGVECEILLGHGEEPYREIVEEAEYSNMDLIVMGRRDKYDLSRALLGGTAAKVIGNTTRNVLVVPRGASFKNEGILLAVDGSRHADAATAAVVGLPGLYQTPVTAISATVDARLQSDAQTVVNRAKDWLTKAGVTVTAEVRVGAPDVVIAEAAKERHADLIVIGSHGRTGLDRLLVGSVSERVIGQALCPVMVVQMKPAGV